MNKLERLIYNTVKNNVALKIVIKRTYQFIFTIVKPSTIISSYKINYIEGYFFGFHDKTPWSFGDKHILAHKYSAANKEVPKKDDLVEVGYFKNGDLENYINLDNTKSWNWQQGSMLQWLGEKEEFIYNFWDGKETVSKIMNLKGELIKTLPFSIGTISNNGVYAISYDFERLNIGMYGYGYANETYDKSFDLSIPENMGFTIHNVELDKKISFKSINELNENLGIRKFTKGFIFVTHFLFSPNNDRFFFLIRSYSVGKRLESRLVSYDLNCQNMHVFSTGNMVSHLTWVNSNQVLAYCTDINENEGYFLFDDLCDKYVQIAKKDYSADGHPQYNNNNKLVVTDTYPDRRRLQELSVYDIHNKTKKIVGKYYSPLKFSEEYRSDLHPRWNRKGDKIAVDATFSGKRSLAIIDFGNENRK